VLGAAAPVGAPVGRGGLLHGRAWHIEETVVAVLHLLHHTQQERFTFPGGLAFLPCFSLPFHGGVLAGRCRFQLPAPQLALQTQQVTLLLQGEKRRYVLGDRLL
jgi:hypothetical protein